MSKGLLHNPAVIDRLRKFRPLYDRVFNRQVHLRPEDQPAAILKGLDGRAIFLLSFGRSGSTVFSDFLGSHPDIVKLGEVLNEATFHSYFRSAGQRLRGWRPSRMKHDFYRFVRSRVRSKPRSHLLFDMKFECLHLLDGNFRNPGYHFELFDALRGSGCPVILLERRDHVARYLSLEVAMHRGVFHSYQQGGGEVPPLTIDVAAMDALISAVRAQIEHARTWFSGYPKFLSLTYEELFITDEAGKSGFDPALASRIAELIGVPPSLSLAPRLERLSSAHAADPIANRAEIDAYRQTQQI